MTAEKAGEVGGDLDRVEPGTGVGAVHGPGTPPCSGADNEPDESTDVAAIQLREASSAAFLYTSMSGFFRDLDPASYQRYRDQVLAECGSPSDPVEVMLLEQLLLAHHNVGRLQFRAATAATLEEARAFGEMGIRLMAEFRRSALALKDYRAPATAKQVTVVRQQNVAQGDQQIALVEGEVKGRTGRRKTA